MKDSALAVVVIGRNEGNRLVACLESVRRSHGSHAPAELIYVDSNSTDGSPERAAALGATVLQAGPGKQSAARARNLGWRSAGAPFILFLDGDTILERDFIDRAMMEFDNPSVSVVWGHRREAHPEASIYNEILDLDWIYPPGVTDFCGGDAIMRRASLEQANGFDAGLIAGEEPDLCRRMRAEGQAILHIDVPMTRHDLAITHFRQYWQRSVRAGYAYAEIAARYRNTSDAFWTRESRANLFRGLLYTVATLGLCVTSILLRSWIPFLAGALVAAALMLRTAISSRWKGVSWKTLLLFGIHSHVQQIPVLQGQLRHLLGRWRNQNSQLIEYKDTPR
jgi:glycosyltransferase involved in cell wall biosynthesis